MHSDNSAATPTPVTDGERIFAYFGSVGLLCTDTDGKVVWTAKELAFEARHGVASSPILCGEKVIVLSESDVGGYLAALDCETGRPLWKTNRGKKIHRYAGNCRTPAIKEINGRKTVVVWGHTDISGYDPLSGEELWSHEVGDFGKMNNPVASMVSDDKCLYLVGPRNTMALAMDRLATDRSPVVWEQKTSDGAQCPSPVVKDGLLFAISDVGTAYCLDANTGEALWRERFRKQHYASPISIGDQVYFSDTSGLTIIVACDREYRKIAENDLDELTHASFAPLDGRLFIRTGENLYCVREQ